MVQSTCFKFLFIVCSLYVSVTALSEEMEQVIKMLHTTCQDRTQVPEVCNNYYPKPGFFAIVTNYMIQNCLKGDFADDERLKCYFKCIMTEMATMDDDGEIDVEGTIAVLPEEFQATGIPATIRKCGTQKGPNACDTAWLTNKCYYDDNPKDFFVV